MKHAPIIKAFFDKNTNTVSYVISDPETQKAAIIDSVLDFEPASGKVFSESADQIIEYIQKNNLSITWILETHAHADHLSAAVYLQEKLGGKRAIGKHIQSVQEVFGDVFNIASSSSDFDQFWDDGDQFAIGSLSARVLYTPGHTPADVTYVIEDMAFVGDTLFMPDYGSARCDFPGGSAETLYRSVQKIYALPDETRLFMCHDYLPAHRKEHQWETTVAEEKKNNIHVNQSINQDEFITLRTNRDATLEVPTLIIPSLQVNIKGGKLPDPETNDTRYLKIPLNSLFAK